MGNLTGLIQMMLIIVLLMLNYANGINITTNDFGTLIGSTAASAWTHRRIYQFLGVRYAKPPSGERRFKEPEIAIPWPGIHDVRQYGIACPNLRDLRKRPPPSEQDDDLEDCLHMSIYTTSLKAHRPVLVYIHGGSYTEGSSTNHPPNYLLERDIVLVVPQYRLGPLGFLCTQTVDIPCNAGLQDVLLALRWIHQYIEYFGGNPRAITIAGQSAGASIVTAILFNPTIPDGLFQQAIVQSGSYLGPSTVDLDPVATAVGIADVSPCYNIETIEQINRCFMEIDVLSLLETYHRYSNYDHGKRMSLAFDNNLIVLTPADILKGKIPMKNVTLLTGTTKHDGGFILAKFYDFLLKNVGLNNKVYNSFHLLDEIVDFIGVDDYTGSFSGYLTDLLYDPNILMEGNFTKLLPGLMDISNVITMKGPIFKTAQLHSKFTSENTFLYTFDYRGEYSYLKAFNTTKYPYSNGVQHCDDLIYLFPYPEYAIDLNEADQQMARTMIDLWTSFVIDGKPFQSNGKQPWLPLTNLLGPYYHINDKSKMGKNYLKQFSVISRESGLIDVCERKTNYYYYSVL